MVFTAFLLQMQPSHAYKPGTSNPVSKSWYPSIYFYDVKKGMIVWEIFGAEQFIDICADTKEVKVLTNEIWHSKTKEEYERLMRNDGSTFTRHHDFLNYLKTLRFGITSSTED